MYWNLTLQFKLLSWDDFLIWYQSLDGQAVTSSNLVIFIYLIKIKHKIIQAYVSFKFKKFSPHLSPYIYKQKTLNNQLYSYFWMWVSLCKLMLPWIWHLYVQLDFLRIFSYFYRAWNFLHDRFCFFVNFR